MRLGELIKEAESVGASREEMDAAEVHEMGFWRALVELIIQKDTSVKLATVALARDQANVPNGNN